MNRLIDEKRFLEITGKLDSLAPVLVVGDLGIDKYTYGKVDRVSPEAPVPVVAVTREWEKLGLAANVAHNLKALDVGVTLCGIVGSDQKAQQLKKLLGENQIGDEGLVCDQVRPTIFKERVLTEKQQICRIDYEDSTPMSEMTGQLLVERVGQLIKDHQGMILEDYGKGTFSRKVLREIIDLGKSSGKLVAIDPNSNTPPNFYKGATLLKPNLKEAESMVGMLGYPSEGRSVEQMSTILLEELALEKLVITLGSQGMALLDREENRELSIIPTVAQEVFDVSGAGDTAISLLTTSLLAGASLREAAWISNCAAGLVVGKRGTATVAQEELTIFYHRTREQQL